jgi:hypothetical protein
LLYKDDNYNAYGHRQYTGNYEEKRGDELGNYTYQAHGGGSNYNSNVNREHDDEEEEGSEEDENTTNTNTNNNNNNNEEEDDDDLTFYNKPKSSGRGAEHSSNSANAGTGNTGPSGSGDPKNAAAAPSGGGLFGVGRLLNFIKPAGTKKMILPDDKKKTVSENFETFLVVLDSLRIVSIRLIQPESILAKTQ